jgi:hypothetical protein
LNDRDQVQEIHKCMKGFVFLGTDHYNSPGIQGFIERMLEAFVLERATMSGGQGMISGLDLKYSDFACPSSF